MSQLPRLLLAAAPGSAPPQFPVPVERVHTGYRIGSDGRLLRAPAEGNWRGGVLMVNGSEDCPGEVDVVCRQVGSECRARNATGVVGNWPSAPQWAPLVTRLEHALTQAGLELWVPEYFAPVTEAARLLLSSQLSGGTLTERLSAARERWGARVALAVECSPWVFPLPCAPGEELPLEPERLRQMLARQPRVWFSEALCTQYFTCMAEDGLRLVLFDNAASVRRKLELAAQCGLSEAILSWEEIAPFSKKLFPAVQTPRGPHF